MLAIAAMFVVATLAFARYRSGERAIDTLGTTALVLALLLVFVLHSSRYEPHVLYFVVTNMAVLLLVATVGAILGYVAARFPFHGKQAR